MEEPETLHNSVSIGFSESLTVNFSAPPPQRRAVGLRTNSILSFPETPKEFYLNIISANFNKSVYQLGLNKTTDTRTSLDASTTGKDSIRQDYVSLKKKYLASLSKQKYLQEAIGGAMCSGCAAAQEEHGNTQKALQESIQFTNIVLKEVHRLATEGFY